MPMTPKKAARQAEEARRLAQAVERVDNELAATPLTDEERAVIGALVAPAVEKVHLARRKSDPAYDRAWRQVEAEAKRAEKLAVKPKTRPARGPTTAAPPAPIRRTDAGCQVVEVDGLAHRWSGHEPLNVGDRVLLPENWLSKIKNGPGPFEGTVSRIGTTYDGPLLNVVRKL